MDIRDRRGLKSAAENALACAPNNKKIVLIWAGVSTVLPLLVSVISFMLSSQISDTGGLSGIGLRSVLSTVQSLLTLATSILVPFWTLGYTAVTLRFARKKPADPTTLLDGFRRFGTALGLMLLKALIYTAVCFASFYIGIMVLSVTPLADSVYDVLIANEQMLLSGTIDESILQAATAAMLPLFTACGVLCFLVLIPVMYRLRLTELRIMDSPSCGAFSAIRESRYLMRRNCIHLFLLDLSFWWFYLTQFLLVAVCYGDVILPLLGVSLPFSDDAAYFIFYIAGLVAQMILSYCFSNKVQTTYALFYDTLRTPPENEKTPVV